MVEDVQLAAGADENSPALADYNRPRMVDLDLLPIIQHNEFDAGRYIDAAPLVMKERGTGQYNAGIYRHQKQGKNQLGVMINPANHGNYLRAEYEAHGEDTPCYLCIGHHPAVFISAVAKIPGIGKELETDADGSFLADVDPGSYEVVIEADGHARQRRRVEVPEDGVVILNADLLRGEP